MMDTELVPLLVSVSDWLAEFPAAIEVKFTLVGLAARVCVCVPCTPDPDTGIESVELEALLLTITVPEYVLTAVGLNVTLRLTVAPAANV